jgi:D-beta-D-heptose 7-phosphate kinase/D-beta-D-heptose 1-phosphate adenosyltransferase
VGEVLSLTRLRRKVERRKRAGQRVAFTNGCFDLLHAGHVSYLEAIRRKADCLVVAVNSDRSVRGLKGPGRPLTPARQRCRVLAGLRAVDFVTVFDAPTPLALIRALRPDLLAKGGDWKRSQIVGADFVRSHGGRVVVVPYLAGHSTTGLIRRIQRLT